MARIGIYGGSFNPPHLGHIRAALETRRLLRLDRVILIPDAVPPHKMLAPGSPDAKTRLALVRLAIAGCDGLEVSDIELRRDGPSYTVDTLRQLHTQYPQDELFLLMGTDMFLTFDQWRGPEDIARMAALVCMYRTEKNGVLTAELQEKAQMLRRTFGARVEFAENDALELSSTQARRLIFFGCGAQCVPEAVLEKIEGCGLYGLSRDYHRLPLEALERICEPLYKPKRWLHALGCSETAAQLARRYGAAAADARRAGILHDVTKALTDAEQIALCEQFAIAVTPSEQESPWLLHAKTAAWAAEHIFGEEPELCSAIRWHTTGRANMTTLEKIIYIADYMEPNRDFPGVDRLREAVWRDLDEGVLLGIDMTLEQLAKKSQPACADSLAARDWLLSNR